MAGQAGKAGSAEWAGSAGSAGQAGVCEFADGEDLARRETIAQHRGWIDRIDKTIVALLAERVRLGMALGDLKRDLRLPSRSEAREAEVLMRVRQAAVGPLSSQAAARIFTTIIAETTAAQDVSHD
jgi:chorismate mutase